MRKRLHIEFFLLSVCILRLFSRDLIIAGIPEQPNRWIDESGEVVGLDIDIITYIMNEMDIPFKVILEESSARLSSLWKLQNPPYDMVFTYSIKSERQAYLYYAHESHITFSWNFFIRKEDENKYKYEYFNDLKGLRIGATTGFSYTDEFWEIGKRGDIFELDICVTNESQIKKLLMGRFDMVPLNTQATLYDSLRNGFADKIAYLPKPIKSKPYYNTFVKASDYPDLDKIREEYDIILARMKADGTLEKILSDYGM
ncbi:MAG: transporter substrate-binding domain-containing protein [Spirochaetaceae bacterium]|nr:transporter substrate-binding domain-containing protein [Spirochaetaceae bacterium]